MLRESQHLRQSGECKRRYLNLVARAENDCRENHFENEPVIAGRELPMHTVGKNLNRQLLFELFQPLRKPFWSLACSQNEAQIDQAHQVGYIVIAVLSY